MGAGTAAGAGAGFGFGSGSALMKIGWMRCRREKTERSGLLIRQRSCMSGILLFSFSRNASAFDSKESEMKKIT